MGDLRPDNGNGWPPDDGQGGLSGLPPEWGSIVIPNDAAELDPEADAIRRELRRTARRARQRAWLHLKPRKPGPHRPHPSGVPIMIMVVAVLASMISLILVTWGPRPTQPIPAATHATPNSGGTVGIPTAELTLIGARNQTVRLGTLLPAVILLVDGCACDALVLDTVATVSAGISVIAVGTTAPILPGVPATVFRLADPAGALRGRYFPNSARASAASVIMIDSSGVALSIIQAARTIDDLRSGIAGLG
jgi:hypothetical protein